MAGIQIFAENREQTLELLRVGRDIASTMGTKVSVYVCKARDGADEYIACGADAVLVMPPLSDDEPLDAYVPVMADEAKQADPDVILVAATLRGKEMAARLAARLNTGMCSDCMALDFEEGEGILKMERLAYGGAALQRVTCTTRPVVVTIMPRTFEPAESRERRRGEIRELPAPPPSPVKVVGRKKKETAARDIREAKVVVCAGRGIDKKEDLALIRDLAEALGGEVGCTRPVSEEQHWLPEDLCIGLSGVSVKPGLYIGLGVSGQVQHVTGIRDAKVICAVNKDENAPIFNVANYGIVGDLYDVVPQLIEEVKKAALNQPLAE